MTLFFYAQFWSFCFTRLHVCETNDNWVGFGHDIGHETFTKTWTKDKRRRCVGMGGELKLKWTHIYCKHPGKKDKDLYRKVWEHRPICVSTANMSDSKNHFEFSSTAAVTLEPFLKKAGSVCRECARGPDEVPTYLMLTTVNIG